MLNHVLLEGIIVSRWHYKGEEFLRLAHHRPRQPGELIHSDYVTIRVGQEVRDLPDLQQGDLVRVQGEVWGKDILEPLGRLLQKARLNVEVSEELAAVIIPRPTAYVLARDVRLVDAKEEAFAVAAQVAGRPVGATGRSSKNTQPDTDEELEINHVSPVNI